MFTTNNVLASTSQTDNNVACVRQLFETGRRLIIKMVANELNLSSTVLLRIVIEDLGIRKVSVKLMPKVLSDDQETSSKSPRPAILLALL